MLSHKWTIKNNVGNKRSIERDDSAVFRRSPRNEPAAARWPHMSIKPEDSRRKVRAELGVLPEELHSCRLWFELTMQNNVP